MSDSFRHHINTKFGSCKLVALGRDPHRNRDVKLFHIPGNFEHVGIFDGIDCFIAPITIDPFSANIKRIYDDIRAGKEIVVTPLKKMRVRVDTQGELDLPPPEPPSKPRVKWMTETPPCATHAKERIRVRP